MVGILKCNNPEPHSRHYWVADDGFEYLCEGKVSEGITNEELERQIRVLNVKVNVIVETLDRCFYRRSRDLDEEHDDNYHVEIKIDNRLRELGLSKEKDRTEVEECEKG